ncbi:TPA: recombination protein RecR, partial [Candidatus Azambacteria bacterium]|nr:recombination protein RecR [Candidatus Azambacteria bacterium]HBC59310.1 recombination protein RecR [Candidatus Azambacteria bacterium]
MYPNPIQEFIARFASLPSIGPRQASRLAFHLLKKSTGELQ